MKEKEFTRLRDELTEQRRGLPWEAVTSDYVFDGPSGKQSLAELFEGRSQLIVYHFMFHPEDQAGCPHCSIRADGFDGIPVHLDQRDVTFVVVSRAPYAWTKLTWQQSYDPVPSLPNGVANYCVSLTLGGGGWRAPSVKELESIVDDFTLAPALDAAFLIPGRSGGDFVFWSSSAWAPAPMFNKSWYVDFVDGSNGTGDSSIPIPPSGGNNNFYQVRCVK